MEIQRSLKGLTKCRRSCRSAQLLMCCSLLLCLILLIFNLRNTFDSSYAYSPTSASRAILNKWKATVTDFSSSNSQGHSNGAELLTSRLRDSVTFLPLKDLRFVETASKGHTWFMSSVNDTYEENEAEHLLFPSEASKGRLLCMKGRNKQDGTKNSYALAWPESLPESATLLKGLTFVSDTYYDYNNPWHGLTAMAPFVGWSTKNGCVTPNRWVLFHWGELRDQMGSWLRHLMQANFGEVEVDGLEGGDGPYCFEKAVVMRHNQGSMGKARKLQVCDLLRCKARGFCGINPAGKGQDVDGRGQPIIGLTLLMRRGARSFKNSTAVIALFARECRMVKGCVLNVVQPDDLKFCDQVKVMTGTDVLVSPHGAQLTNMLFMDRNSSVMEFFPKGWLELAGSGQYVYHWMADQSGMRHRGAWRDPTGKKECPAPQHDLDCFYFYKDGQIGHNETYFAEWARSVLNQVRISKLEQGTKSRPDFGTCLC